MKAQLRKVFRPILKPFEQGEGEYVYKPLNRKILLVFGFLFGFLSLAVCIIAPRDQGPGFLLPVLVFGAVSAVSLIVGFLGNERAVARIWNNK